MAVRNPVDAEDSPNRDPFLVIQRLTGADPKFEKGNEMVLAIVLIVLAILLGLGGLLFTAVKWLLIVAVVLLVAGVVAGFLGRRKARSLR